MLYLKQKQTTNKIQFTTKEIKGYQKLLQANGPKEQLCVVNSLSDQTTNQS